VGTQSSVSEDKSDYFAAPETVNCCRIIRKIMTRAINYHHHSIEAASNMSAKTELQPSDMCYSAEGDKGCKSLPLIPDVVVHYRCGDTVPSTTYGFLPFTAFKPLIDIEPETIYILTDPAARTNILSSGNKFQANCRPILQALFDHFRSIFPRAAVAVKSGGDPFLDYARLMKAKITICSGTFSFRIRESREICGNVVLASTFCLWPAIAAKGKAYFPVSTVVVGKQLIAGRFG
jgi:hypothetical protein